MIYRNLKSVIPSVALGILGAIQMTSVASAAEEVNVYTHRHYDADKQLFEKFTSETGIEVNIVNASADQLIQRLISEAENSPADVLFTVDAGRLARAKTRGLLQPIESEVLESNIPSPLRDPDGEWFGFTVRSRVILYSKERVKPDEISDYEDLADPKWKNRVLIRSSTNVYNQSLLASIILANGPEKAEAWARATRRNMARPPRGSDRDQIRGVAAGLGDLAVANTYYLGLLANSENANDRRAAEAVGVLFPNQDGRGAHINVSGAGVTRHAKNRANAIRLLEFLSESDAQRIYAEANYEYPVNPKIEPSEFLKKLGDFKRDDVNLQRLGEKSDLAVEIFDRANWQ